MNFDLIENGVRLDLVDDEYTVLYRSKAIYELNKKIINLSKYEILISNLLNINQIWKTI